MLFLEPCLSFQENLKNRYLHQYGVILRNRYVMFFCQKRTHVFHRHTEAVRESFFRNGGHAFIAGKIITHCNPPTFH